MAACHAVGCSFRVVARLTCRATGRCADPAGSLVNSNRTTTKVAQNMRAEWCDGGCYRERDGANYTPRDRRQVRDHTFSGEGSPVSGGAQRSRGPS
jgi:hypothetical protein